MNILLTLILVVLLGIIATNFVAFFICRRIYKGIIAFITPTASDKPSQLAITVQAASEVVARTITAQLKTTFMGISSGDARSEKALEGDIAQDLVAQSPLGAILSSFPSVAKTLRRNPQLVDMAMGLLAKKFGSGSSGNGQNSVQAKFKL